MELVVMLYIIIDNIMDYVCELSLVELITFA